MNHLRSRPHGQQQPPPPSSPLSIVVGPPPPHDAAARRSLLGYPSEPRGGAWLGSETWAAGGGGGAGPRNGHRGVDEVLLEQANDRQVEELQTRVGAIRHITLEIEAELHNSNRLLDEMNFTLDSTRALLETAMKKLEQVTGAAGSRHMIYLFLFCFFIFGLLYFMIR